MTPGASLRSLARDERPTSTRAIAGRLIGYLRPYRGLVAAGLAWLVVASAAQASVPALTGRLIDAAVAAQGSSLQTLIVPGLLLVGATIVGWISQRAQILVLGTAGQKALFALRAEVFEVLQALPVGFYESVESGDLMSRLINDIEQVNSFLSQGFRRLLGSGLGLVMTLVAMVWTDWRLAVATLLILPVMYLVSRLFGMVARRAFQRRQEAIGDVSATLAEELAGIKVTQAFSRTDRTTSEFVSRNQENRDASVSAAAVSSAFSPVLAIISTFATALVAVLGGYLATQDIVTIGVVVAFFGYSRQFFNAVSQLSSLYAGTQSALAGAERVFALTDTPITVTDPPEATVLERLVGRIEYRDVSFSYATGPPVLHDIDLVVEPGTTVAIVGPTGAGKTTLVNLVPRFYDPTSGSLLVDGNDAREVASDSLRESMGIVLQEPFLFSGTVADNIRYGRLDATEQELRSAAATARALDFIEKLPAGFDTEVGERGVMLSTGQRQLIAFARAILADPSILILDEATSSVDTRTELLIQQALHALLEGRTALIIAHRLSTVRDADRIIVLDSGRVVEDGTYDELLSAGGPFAALNAAQFSE